MGRKTSHRGKKIMTTICSFALIMSGTVFFSPTAVTTAKASNFFTGIFLSGQNEGSDQDTVNEAKEAAKQAADSLKEQTKAQKQKLESVKAQIEGGDTDSALEAINALIEEYDNGSMAAAAQTNADKVADLASLSDDLSQANSKLKDETLSEDAIKASELRSCRAGRHNSTSFPDLTGNRRKVFCSVSDTG